MEFSFDTNNLILSMVENSGAGAGPGRRRGGGWGWGGGGGVVVRSRCQQE